MTLSQYTYLSLTTAEHFKSQAPLAGIWDLIRRSLRSTASLTCEPAGSSAHIALTCPLRLHT